MQIFGGVGRGSSIPHGRLLLSYWEMSLLLLEEGSLWLVTRSKQQSDIKRRMEGG
jgi:hypothetical protein